MQLPISQLVVLHIYLCPTVQQQNSEHAFSVGEKNQSVHTDIALAEPVFDAGPHMKPSQIRIEKIGASVICALHAVMKKKQATVTCDAILPAL